MAVRHEFHGQDARATNYSDTKFTGKMPVLRIIRNCR